MTIKRSITFTNTTSNSLDSLIPKSNRSRFVDGAVTEALKKIAKQRALEILENVVKMSANGPSVVETLQEIRQSESGRLTNNNP